MIALDNTFQMILHPNTACLEICQMCGLVARKQVNQTGMYGLAPKWMETWMTISDSGQFSTAKPWKLVTGSLGSRCMAAILQRFLLILTALHLFDNWHAGTRFEKKNNQPEEQHGFRGGLCLKACMPGGCPFRFM